MHDPLVAALAIGRQFLLRDVVQVGVAPGVARQQIVGLRQGQEPALEGFPELRRVRTWSAGSGRDGLHGRQGVLHPVVQLVEKKPLLLLGLLARGDVLEDPDEMDRLAERRRRRPGPWS